MDELTVLVRSLCHAVNARSCDLSYSADTGRWRVEIVKHGILLTGEGDTTTQAMLAVARKIGDTP